MSSSQLVITDCVRSPESPPVGIKLSAFNWHLRGARLERGLTQAQLGLLCGIHTQRIGVIETLRARPNRDEQDEIASALDLDRQVLFPSEVLALCGLGSSTLSVAVPSDRVASLACVLGGDEQLDIVGLREAFAGCLDILTQRERRVLQLRFGVEGGDGSRTLEETSRELAVTRERIRQIEAKALRKLRHPSRSKKLMDYLVEYTVGASCGPIDEARGKRFGALRAVKRRPDIEFALTELQRGLERRLERGHHDCEPEVHAREQRELLFQLDILAYQFFCDPLPVPSVPQIAALIGPPRTVAAVGVGLSGILALLRSLHYPPVAPWFAWLWPDLPERLRKAIGGGVAAENTTNE